MTEKDSETGSEINSNELHSTVSGSRIINRSTRDIELINMLVACEGYILKQRELDQELSNGFYRLTQSRRNRGSHVYGVEDIRFDIEPELCLHEDDQALGPYKLGEEVPASREDRADSIYLLSAMPPPPLRTAQMHFRKTLQLSVDLAKEMKTIQRAIEVCLLDDPDR